MGGEARRRKERKLQAMRHEVLMTLFDQCRQRGILYEERRKIGEIGKIEKKRKNRLFHRFYPCPMIENAIR